MSRSVGILESTPSAHIVNKNRPKFCLTANNILQQRSKALAVLDDYAAFTGIFVVFYDIEAFILRILSNSSLLICNRILLILRRHSKILCCGNRSRGRHHEHILLQVLHSETAHARATTLQNMLKSLSCSP
jgi:hypothetical protein